MAPVPPVGAVGVRVGFGMLNGCEPRGNPPKVKKVPGAVLVSGWTAVRFRKLKHAHEIVAPWAEDDDPVRLR